MNGFVERMKRIGWIEGVPFDTYQFQLSRISCLFIFKNTDGWYVCRLKWRMVLKKPKEEGEEEPETEWLLEEETIRETFYDFRAAVERAHKYIQWYKQSVNKTHWEKPNLREWVV